MNSRRAELADSDSPFKADVAPSTPMFTFCFVDYLGDGADRSPVQR